MERDVGSEKVRDGLAAGVPGHLVDEILQAGQIGLGDPRDGQAHGHDLEGLADLVSVDEFLGGQGPDLCAAPRPHRDQPFGGQAAQGLADRAAAYLQFLGKRHLGQLGSGREAVGQDLPAEVVIDPLGQGQVVGRHRHERTLRVCKLSANDCDFF